MSPAWMTHARGVPYRRFIVIMTSSPADASGTTRHLAAVARTGTSPRARQQLDPRESAAAARTSRAFPIAIFVGLAVTSVVHLPIARYDALLVYAIALTAGFWLLRVETGREVAVIFAFHLVGLALELFKVRMGSWSYHGDAATR